MNPSEYYTGTPRNNANNPGRAKIRTIPFINNQNVVKKYNCFLDIVALIGVVLGVVSISLSTASIIHHSRNSTVSTRWDSYIPSMAEDIKQLVRYYNEYMDPRLRNIVDAVTFQIPKALSSITSSKGFAEIEAQQATLNTILSHINTVLHDSLNTISQLTSVVLDQFEETKLIVREINNEILNPNKSLFALKHPFLQYPRIHTVPTCYLPALTCTRNIPSVAPKRIPAFVSNVGGMMENSCVKEVVISSANGIIATTYLFFRTTCTDYQSSIRFFEIGLIKRATDLDPYPSIIHTWDRAAPFVIHPCSLAVAYDQAYALCSESVTGIDNDLITGNTIRLVLFTFTLLGGFERKIIHYDNFQTPRSFTHMIPLVGQSLIKGDTLYSFGYLTTDDAPTTSPKCPFSSCTNLQQSTCTQFSKTIVDSNTHKEMLVIAINLTTNVIPNHFYYKIQRSSYYILAHGNLYDNNNTGSFLFQLYNNGWYHKPLVGKLILGTPCILEYSTKDYDSLSGTASCIPGYGCPSSCEITAYGSYFPLDNLFTDAVAIVPRSSGMYPSISYGSANTRIDFRAILNHQVALRETSLFCYLPTISNRGSPYCIGLLTVEVPGQAPPQLYSISWEQDHQCRK
ncbi:cell attachment protein [denestis virus]|uniref:Cell attachment protein n=1 Tax=denestis virus TaxID=2940992 RepID=A0AAE9HTW6_9MONO|nr:cell attachment protein [denestis virus]